MLDSEPLLNQLTNLAQVLYLYYPQGISPSYQRADKIGTFLHTKESLTQALA
jgi:hypothetical protein